MWRKSALSTLSQQQKETLIGVCRNWVQKASANGFNRLSNHNVYMKRLWMLIIICGYAGLCIHSYYLFCVYCSYPVNNQMLLQSSEAKMPDVTICRSGLVYNSKDLSFLKNITDASKIWQLAYEKNEYVDNLRYQLKHYRRASIFEKVVANELVDYMIYCSYQGKLCSEKNFSRLIHPLMLDCFTFVPPSRKLYAKGNVMSLVLDGYDWTDDGDTKWIIGDGYLYVMIHEQNTIPNPVSEGYMLEPGRRNTITFNTKKLERINTPVHPCHHTATTELQQELHEGRETWEPSPKDRLVHLTKEDCFDRKAQDIMVAKCGCKSPFYRFWNDSVPNCFEIPGNCVRYPELLQRVMERNKLYQIYSKLSAKKSRGKSSVSTSVRLGLSQDNPIVEDDDVLENDAIYAHYVRREVDATYKIFNCHQQVMDFADRNLENVHCPKRCEAYDVKVVQFSKTIAPFTKEQIHNIATGPIRSNLGNNKTYHHQLKDEYGGDPSEKAYQSFLDFCIRLWHLPRSYQDEIELYDKNETYAMAWKRLIQLDIYVETVPADTLKETRDYPFVSLFSEFGGLLGLWTGISLISICEFIELITAGMGVLGVITSTKKEEDLPQPTTIQPTPCPVVNGIEL